MAYFHHQISNQMIKNYLHIFSFFVNRKIHKNQIISMLILMNQNLTIHKNLELGVLLKYMISLEKL